MADNFRSQEEQTILMALARKEMKKKKYPKNMRYLCEVQRGNHIKFYELFQIFSITCKAKYARVECPSKTERPGDRQTVRPK